MLRTNPAILHTISLEAPCSTIDNASPTKANSLTDKTKIDLNSTSPQNIKRPHHSKHTANVFSTHNARERKRYLGLSLRHWVFLCGMFAATFITWMASQSISQFEQHGPVAFHDGFPGDLEQWTRRGGWENILFEQSSIKVHRHIDKASFAVRTFTLSPSKNRAQEKLRVSGLVNTIKKKPTTDQSVGGSVMIWLQDDSDKVVKYLTIGRLDGLSDHYEVTRVINLTENITRFSLILTNKQTSAEFALVDASVLLLTEQPMFHKARVVVFTIWAIIFMIVLHYLFVHASKAMFAVIATVMSLTIIGVLMPENIRSGTIKPVYEVVQNLSGIDNNFGLVYAFKIGHFIFFFLSTLILLLYRKTLKLLTWEIVLLVILFAIATEGLQLYLLDRSTRFTDLIIDFSAIVVGAILTALIVTIRAKRPNGSESATAVQ